MQSPSPEQSVRSTGLPPGVEAGELGPRFLAAVIDWLAPALVVGILNLIAATLDPGAGRVVLTLLGSLVGLAWFVFVWWMFATKAAGPGMRVMKLQLVGLSDGRPVGWLRYLGRYVILSLLTGTGIGLIVLLVLLLQNTRRQGLHDLVVDSVVIKERALAPRPASAAPSAVTAGGQTQVTPSAPGQAPTQMAPPAAASGPDPYPQPASAGPGQSQPLYGPQSRAYQPAANPLQPPVSPLQPPAGAPAPSPASADFPVGGEYPMHVPAGTDPAGPESGVEAGTPDSAPAPASTTMSEPAAPNPVSTVFPAAAPPSVTESAAASTGDESPAPEPVVQPAAPPARPLDEGWVAGLDDGRDLDIAGLVLLGRNPQGRPGEDDAELIKIADDTRTVSKTHLALGVDANGMYVMDRGSTNGSTVTSAGGFTTPCPPGAVIQVDEGNIVSFGDHWLEIKRTPTPEH